MIKFVAALSGFSIFSLSTVLAVAGGEASGSKKPQVILRGLSVISAKKVIEIVDLIVDGEKTTVEKKAEVVVERKFLKNSPQLDRLQEILRSSGPTSDEIEEFAKKLCSESSAGYKAKNIVKGLDKIESEVFKPEAIQIDMKLTGFEPPIDSIDGPITIECED